jgi:hypothetical protein
MPSSDKALDSKLTVQSHFNTTALQSLAISCSLLAIDSIPVAAIAVTL